MLKQKSLDRLKAMYHQAKINSKNNTDEQALAVSALYPNWSTYAEGNTLTAGERVNYNGTLYNVIQTHQKQELWTPVNAPSLFAKVLIPDVNSISEWEQPDGTNAYAKGDKVTHNGKTWESLVDGNVWEPDALGSETLWKEV